MFKFAYEIYAINYQKDNQNRQKILKMYIYIKTTADRRGAAGRCSTAVREVPGSNPGSGMDVVFFRCWFSLLSLLLVNAVWNRHGKLKNFFLPMSFRAISFVLNWLTVTITKSNKVPIVICYFIKTNLKLEFSHF